MKTRYLTVIVALPLLMAADTPQWKEVKNDERFSALMPGESKGTWQRTPEAKVATYTYPAAKDAAPSYMVNVTEVKDDIPDASRQRVLASVRDNLIKRMKGQIVTDKAVERDEVPGREFVAKVANEKTPYFRAVILVRKNRVYQAIVTGSEADAKGADGDKFIKSFKLVADSADKK
jgi:hypothetical protein